MPTLTFDTHKIAKNLKKAGFNDQQIEAQTETAKEVFHTSLEQMREEVNPKKLATLNDLTYLKNDLHIVIEKSKNNILMWVAGIILAQTSFIFGFFGKVLHLF